MTVAVLDHNEILRALADDSGDQVLQWLTERLLPVGLPPDSLRLLAASVHWNFAADADSDTDADTDTDADVAADPDRTVVLGDVAQIDELVWRTYAVATRVPYAPALLTLYLKHECERAWEVSWGHEPIRRAIRAAHFAWEHLAQQASEADRALLPELLGCLRILDHELVVEAAAATTSTAKTTECARQTADVAGETYRQASAKADGLAGDPVAAQLLAYARDCGARESLYYAAVAAAAKAFGGYFTAGPDRLDEAIEALRAAEEDELTDEIDRSELRAHRANLTALAAVRDRPWLRVDHGTVTYVYPFGLRGVPRPCSPEQVVTEFRRGAGPWTLADLPVQQVRQELLLNDVWQGDDPHGRQYGGAEAVLPDVLLPDPDGGDAVRLQVALRMSDLGNHYLRFTTELTGAAPPQLYAAMLRPAPEYGDVTELGLAVTDGDGNPLRFSRLADLAATVIDDLAARLSDRLGTELEHSGRPGTYHVLVSVQRASCQGRGGPARVLDSGSELVQVLGIQPVWHPVRHGVSAIGEWVRYPVDLSLTVPSPAFTGDLLVRTANSTLLGLFGSPDYMIGAVLEAAEFVATLDGLFVAWQLELAAYYQRINDPLTTMVTELQRTGAAGGAATGAAGSTVSAADLDAARTSLEDLELQQLKLHQFIMTSRRTLTFVTSASLVTSPVMRVTLDRLLDAAGFSRLRSDFEGMVEQVLGNRLGALVETSVRRRQEQQQAIEEDRQREQRRRTDVLLAAIAGAGFAGVFQLLQAGLGSDPWWAGIFAGATILIVVATAVIVYVVSRAKSDTQRPTEDRRSSD